MGLLHDAENSLFDRWEKDLCLRHAGDTCHFVTDGVVNDDDEGRGFDSVRPRLFFVLKDTNGGTCFDLRRTIADGNYQGERGTWWPIANMMAGIDGVKGELKNTPECKAKYFQRIGIMNLKKEPGGGKTNAAALKKFVRDNYRFLFEQISIYAKNPTIFACGGTFDLFRFVLQMNEVRFEERDGMVCFCNECVAFGMWHPAYYRVSLERRVNAFVEKYRRALTLACG